MADEVHSLAVSIHPEGTQKTQDALDDTQESFSETADDVGESTGMMSDFANKFTGAGIVFAGAFGTMVGAIASRMPIISEAFAGLDAILTALALRFDQLTRDDAQPMIQTMFDLADAIATPGEELRALQEALGVVREGLAKAPASFLAPIEAARRLAEVFVDVEEGAEAMVEFVGNLGQRVRNALVTGIVNPFIEKINELIRKANKIPGFNLGTIATAETTAPPPETGGGMFPVNPPGGFADPIGGQQVTVTGTVDSKTNIDSRSVASETKPFTVKGVLGGGRGARLR